MHAAYRGQNWKVKEPSTPLPIQSLVRSLFSLKKRPEIASQNVNPVVFAAQQPVHLTCAMGSMLAPPILTVSTMVVLNTNIGGSKQELVKKTALRMLVLRSITRLMVKDHNITINASH